MTNQKSVIEQFDFGKDVNALDKDDLARSALPIEDNTKEKKAAATKVNVADVIKASDDSAKKALMDEAKSALGVVFTYDGETYTIPRVDDWDIEVFEAQEAGRLITMARLLLGDDQYEKFKTEPDPDNPGERRIKKRVMKDLDAFLSAGTNAMGVTPGE